MRTYLRIVFAITAVTLVVMFALTSDWPLTKFEFTVLQMLAMLIILKAIEK